MNVHPKTSGAAVGTTLGVLVVSILGSIHGVHLNVTVASAISSFLAILGAWLVPSDTELVPPLPVAPPSQPTGVTPVTGNQPPQLPPQPPAA